MSALQNRRFTLIKRPTGMAQRTDFEYSTVPAGEPGPGEVMLRVLYLSLDPAMRGWMNESRSYIAPVGLGEVMRAIGLGRVVASNDPMLKPGNFATGLTGVQDYAVVAAKSLNKVDPQLAPLPRYLSALGGTGLTAYFGLLEVGQPEAWRDSGSIRSRGRYWLHGGPNRQNPEMPRSGHRRWSRQVQIPHRRARF